MAQSMKKTFLLSLGAVVVGSSTIFGFSNQASAFDVKAGPIWNNNDAKVKCPVAVAARNAKWNGQWRTTVQGRESVCSAFQEFNIKAGPIWNNDDAKVKCPVAAAARNAKWNGQWVTTVWGKESVCGAKRE